MLLAGCGGPPMVQGPADEFAQPPVSASSNTGLVAAMLSGSYSTAAQAELDANFFDVRLHIVPIWTERADGPWLYVEQAMADEQNSPYRQRVYHLIDHGAGAVEVVVYEFPSNPLTFAGAWKDPARMNALDPALLAPRMGCIVLLRPHGANQFVGSTRGNNCESTLRGAVRATSQVTLTPNELQEWDRGYDAAGNQVWGPVTGPYRFLKAHTPDVLQGDEP